MSPGRPVSSRRLKVWMNGWLVGEWTVGSGGAQAFAYQGDWLQNPLRRPLSLSLPLSIGEQGVAGARVAWYFDNLLPDSAEIRKRVATRLGARSADSFDLLEMLGRDCVGAVQLLPPHHVPEGSRKITGQKLSDIDIEARIDATVATTSLGGNADEVPRISLAGAQEKTAFLFHEGHWMLPTGATPSTHIFKLPMGEVGTVRADFSTSVENEWLCAQIVRAYGLPVASCEIKRFGRHKVLVVERFDRQRMAADWLARLPQEDFCQALGLNASQKYQDKGGPGMDQILQILRGSQHAESDRRQFLTAQLLFWMLAAPDGHAKNFSIRLLAAERFQLTPLYDIMSAWPVTGKGSGQFQWQDLKMAMALRSKSTHYRFADIQRRHWNVVAKRNGLGKDFEGVIEQILTDTPSVIDQVRGLVPSDFPAEVADKILAGLQSQAKKLATSPARLNAASN